MAWRPHGRARVDASDPRAFAYCDRCNFLYNHHTLRWQYEWQGTKLQNRRLLVCETCYDEPQEGLRVFTLPPDPVPIVNPRPPRGGDISPTPAATTTPNPDPNNPDLPDIPS